MHLRVTNTVQHGAQRAIRKCLLTIRRGKLAVGEQILAFIPPPISRPQFPHLQNAPLFSFLLFYSFIGQSHTQQSHTLDTLLINSTYMKTKQVPVHILISQEKRKIINKYTLKITLCQTLSSIHILSHSQIKEIISEHDECMKKIK